MHRAIFVLLTVLLALTIAAPAALAQNPHFTRASASGPNADGTLDVNFKIAGLGSNVTITVTASADGTAEYACQNKGGNFPSDPKKQVVSGPVSASDDFTSGKNGTISDSLTLEPPESTLDCPGGQREVLLSVSYDNVTVSGGGATADLGGPFERTFIVI